MRLLTRQSVELGLISGCVMALAQSLSLAAHLGHGEHTELRIQPHRGLTGASDTARGRARGGENCMQTLHQWANGTRVRVRVACVCMPVGTAVPGTWFSLSAKPKALWYSFPLHGVKGIRGLVVALVGRGEIKIRGTCDNKGLPIRVCRRRRSRSSS